jgi:hypothetical protein
MTYSNLYHFVGGIVVSASVALALTTGAWTQNEPQSLEEYERRIEQAPVLLDRDLAEATKSYMKGSMRAHHEQDVAALIAGLGEPYSFTRIYEEGPVELASSREMAEAASVSLYESDYMKHYQGVEAHPIAIVGNLGIQLEIETFEFEDGSKDVSTILSVYEMKDGKLWRNWAFSPQVMDD